MRSIVKNILLALLLLSSSIGSLSIAERSIAVPRNISRLKDGRYTACTKIRQPKVYDESQTCFDFIKKGRKIKGGYEVTQEGPVICVIGTIKNNLITGSAYSDDVNSASHGFPLSDLEQVRRKLPKSKFIGMTTHLKVAQGNLGKIKVGEQIKNNPYDYEARIIYKRSILNLNQFQYISPLKSSDDDDCLK
jgi:hypothetical protein